MAFLFLACTDDVAPSEEWYPSPDIDIIDPDCIVITAAGVQFRMIEVKAGTFKMGFDNGDSDEKPVHTVTISHDFYIGETEVTQALWEAVMGSNPSDKKNGFNYPVTNVSWEDCQKFVTKLNSLLPNMNFRLPTEAEWEFAARGGNNRQDDYLYSGSNTIGDVAWSTENSGSNTHCVMTKSPNDLGLYDMSGNVREWCNDWYNGKYYIDSESIDPMGPEISGSAQEYSSRVVRGGSWYDPAKACSVFSRSYYRPTVTLTSIGLRIVAARAK